MVEDPVDLVSLLVDVAGLSQTELEQLAQGLFRQLYVGIGRCGDHCTTHDGHPVVFWADRADHAFRISDDWARYPHRKNVVDPQRVARIRWIGEIIAGRVQGTGCWEIPKPGSTTGPKRLYAVFPAQYVVWLEPRKQGGWKFSSAYPASRDYIRRKAKTGRKIWERK